MPEMDFPTTITIGDYVSRVAQTDNMKPDIRPVLFGLFGEVGGIMSAAKKHHREGAIFVGYRKSLVEEFGDSLWYLSALCRRLNISLEDVFEKATAGDDYVAVLAASDIESGSVSKILMPRQVAALDDALQLLGSAASALLQVADGEITIDALVAFADSYVKALQVSGVSFGEVARTNLSKTIGRFVPPDLELLPTFDSQFEPEERLPDHFEIEITQRRSGKSYLRWQGVFLGDPLSDNIRDPDGYRFHDVFHLAHAAILHWSPVTRALIKHKRKSDREVDEAQDGGRAIVIEEGLTAWIFARAKELNFFENKNSVSFDMLKTIADFVSGYEVDRCPSACGRERSCKGMQSSET
nr:nucleoside triphosphate pyrophosphohydrolase family protein [Sphingomonas rhizophila]